MSQKIPTKMKGKFLPKDLDINPYLYILVHLVRKEKKMFDGESTSLGTLNARYMYPAVNAEQFQDLMAHWSGLDRMYSQTVIFCKL